MRDAPLLFALLLIAVGLFFNVIAARECPLVYGMAESGDAQQQSATNQDGAIASAVVSSPSDKEQSETDKNGCFRGPIGIPADGWIALFTLALFVSTVGLWVATERGIRSSANALRQTQRAVMQMMQWYSEPFFVDGKTTHYSVAADWRNAGPTTALHCEAGTVYTDIARAPNDSTSIAFSANFVSKSNNYTLAAGSGGFKSRVMIPIHDLVECSNAKKFLFILARIEYEDVFGVPHHTQVCAALAVGTSLRMNATAPFDANESPFFFGVWREHNSSD